MGNALPTTAHKHRLLREERRLNRLLKAESVRGTELRAEYDALLNDPFVVERYARASWNAPPPNTVPLLRFVAAKTAARSR